MDLRGYYQKLRQLEASLPEPCVVISHDTSDGGKAGVRTEVPRSIAAKMVTDGTARVASRWRSSRRRGQGFSGRKTGSQAGGGPTGGGEPDAGDGDSVL